MNLISITNKKVLVTVRFKGKTKTALIDAIDGNKVSFDTLREMARELGATDGQTFTVG
jgi:hypothetical protein